MPSMMVRFLAWAAASRVAILDREEEMDRQPRGHVDRKLGQDATAGRERKI
jgi:hypothetical protein